MRLYDLSSNQFWGGLCRRFDKRVSILHKAGLKGNSDGTGFNATYTRWDSKTDTLVPSWVMSNQFIMHASKRAFFEMLSKL